MSRPFKVFHDGSHPVWYAEVCERLNVKPGNVYIKVFSNGNPINRIDEDVRDFDCFVLTTQGTPMTLYKDIMLDLVYNLQVNSDGRISVVFGYMPKIRSDKEDQPRVVVAARTMTDQITNAGADRVLIMEPHFKQIIGFFDRLKTKVDLMFGTPLLVHALRQEFGKRKYVSVAADLGGTKTAGLVAEKLDVDIALIDKRRKGNDEKAIPDRVVGDIKGKICVITDDEIASGETLLNDARFLIENGADGVIGNVVHPIMTNSDILLQIANEPRILGLNVCDTVPITPEKRALLAGKLHIVHTAPVYAEAINRVNHGQSFRGDQGLLRRMWDPLLFPPMVEKI